MDHNLLNPFRREVMNFLYASFKDHPYVPVELTELLEMSECDVKDLNWNMVYLEKCGYLELTKSYDTMPFVASSASITASGIDLVEDPTAFMLRFPDRES